MYDWDALVRGVPEKTIRNHLAIQKDLEISKPTVAEEYFDIAEEKAIHNGWDSLAQKEYFSNLDKYEDFTFSENNNLASKRTKVPLEPKSKVIKKVVGPPINPKSRTTPR